MPTIPEIKRHQQRQHMRPKDVILAEQSEKLHLLNSLIDGPNPVEALRASLAIPALTPPPPKPPHNPSTKPLPRLSTKPPAARWSPYVLRQRQHRTGWTPEAQIALRDLQGNRCWVCETSDPACFDVTRDEDHQTVYGYLCQRCKGVVDMLAHNPVLFGRAQDYLLNPPSKRMHV